MKNQEVADIYNEFVLSTYTQTPICIVKGKGSRLWDIEDNEYLDFFPGWGVSALGHCHPAVVNAIKHQARKILHVPNNFFNIKQAQLAKEISRVSFPAKTFFCNSGTEANEAAIKFARKFGTKTGRYEIITMRKSFHGRTMGSLIATGQEKVQQGFEPLLEGFKYAEFNDIESVKAQITPKTIAILLEPIQGEGGIQIAKDDFMKGLRALCDEKKMLLILDEVQTGVGRTGKMFAFQHYDIVPDALTLAKALGGGTSIGALVVHNRVQEGVLTPGSHGSTYGGNPLVAASGLAVLKAISQEKLLAKATKRGDYLLGKLAKLKKKYSQVENFRGVGLMCAIELSVPGFPVVEAARRRGLLINCTQDKILRIMPAMTISKKLLDQGLKILEEALAEVLQEKVSCA